MPNLHKRGIFTVTELKEIIIIIIIIIIITNVSSDASPQQAMEAQWSVHI
jgi:hypothetical protein